jgi:tryptophan 7-halogenase
MKFRVAVVGAGSAGIQSLCNLLYRLDQRWEVYSIYDPSIKTLGHIESTNPGFVFALATGADFDVLKDAHHLDSKLKYGTQYKKWRDHEFVNPLVTGIAAMNFDTLMLHDFVFPRLRQQWNDKFVEVHGTVSSIKNSPTKATVIVDGKSLTFDFVIDCRGFSNPDQDPNDYVELDHMVNHALVYMKNESVDCNYTNHHATPDGWMWEIPLLTRTNYGYCFNDNITSVETAKENFAKILNVPLENLKEYKFKSRYNTKIFKNRVIKNGLCAGFIEPMFSNALWLYDNIDGHIFSYIQSHKTIDEIKSQQEIEEYNKKAVFNMKEVEEMLYFCYHGGSTYDTDFWKWTKKTASERLLKGDNLKRVKPIIQDMIKNNHRVGNAVWFYGPHNLIKIDKNFGYNYFVA